MERFVFFAAIAFAVIFGIGALASRGDHDHWGFLVDIDGVGEAPLVEAAPGRLEASAFAGSSLNLRNLAANVTIVPEDRTDFLVEIDNPGATPMPTVEADDGTVTVDGQLRGRIANCVDGGAELRGYGAVEAARLPRITVRAPRTLNVDRGGAGVTEIAAAQELNFDFSGCGVATIADVSGALSLEVAGSGTINAGAADTLKASVAGSGEVSVGAVANGAEVDIAGSGSVIVASLTGDLSVDTAGSGAALIAGGQIAEAQIDIAGSGDVNVAAPIQSLSVDIIGSGNVDVDATVGELEADIAGSGNVRVDAVTGQIRRDVLGSGEVNVGE